jgi:hypothetical protein
MAELQPKDKVEWRAGNTPSTWHVRKGVLKEILPGGTALVATEVEGKTIIEEIRAARLRKVELPAPAKVKKARKKKGKKAAAKGKKGRKIAKKKRTTEVVHICVHLWLKLIRCLGYLEEVDVLEDDSVIPAASLLREFTGGSAYA